MTQEPKLEECRTCKKSAVIKQYLDFMKVGTNNNTKKDIYLLHDHGTNDVHVHKKACIYGCNTVIVWDTADNRYRDLEGGLFHDNPCENVDRYVLMAMTQKDIIDPVRRSQMIAEKANAEAQAVSIDPIKQTTTATTTAAEPVQAQAAPNPIAAELDKAKSTTTSELQKTISTIWEMVKEIDRKISAFEQLKHDRGIMLDDIGKRFDSIDNILADMLTKIQPIKDQFKSGSDLLKQQPTQEELDAMFSDDEDLH